jgi:hypothetical protein
MIFGYTIDFSEFPFLNTTITNTLPKITVEKHDLLFFPWHTEYLPHSGREVRYASMLPFRENIRKKMPWAMHIKDVATLMWIPKEQKIGYSIEKAFTPERLRFWVYHTFLPLLFEMQQQYHIIHAGGVELSDKALLFIAPSFGGKSTLTASLHQDGYRLLGDDTIALKATGKGVNAIASYPFYRPYREPETLGYQTQLYVTKTLDDISLCILKKVPADALCTIEPIHGVMRFKALHLSAFVPIPFLKKQMFQTQQLLLQHIPVYEITVPWDKTRLNEVKTKLIQYFC